MGTDSGGIIHHGDLGPEHPASIADGCCHCIRIAALCRGFRDFGYSTLTIAECREAYHAAMTREVTAADGIIAMLTRSQLIEAGLVKGND